MEARSKPVLRRAFMRMTRSDEQLKRLLSPQMAALVGALVVTLTLMATAGAGATSAHAGTRPPSSPTVPQTLLDAATAHLDATFRVIVQGGRGMRSAAVGDAVT